MPASDEIFLIGESGIKALPSRPFRAGLFGKNLEEALQTLIAKQPNIINGRQIEPGSADPPRFVLLRREMPVGDWSLDHLLVDQRGVPTFVEAKLIDNPEARRAVIGQVLDYVALASEKWGDGQLRQLSAEYWRTEFDKNVDDVIREAFGEPDIDAFWQTVETNLNQCRIRLIIATDELRPEVRRIIELLNQQLRTIQIFGLEIRCFGEEAQAVVVPFLIGQSQIAAGQKMASGIAKIWTPEELRSFYSGLSDVRLGKYLCQLVDWATSRNCFHISGATQTPVFGLSGTTGQKVVTISPYAVYIWLREERYSDAAERDRLLNEVKELGLFPSDFVPNAKTEGKNLSRKLEELDAQEFSRLLEVFSRYWSGVSVAAGH